MFQYVHVYNSDLSMDLDNSQGKQLLRVLLSFTMMKHAPLAKHALKLIFRHFSQRDEMVRGFTEVRELSITLRNCQSLNN